MLQSILRDLYITIRPFKNANELGPTGQNIAGNRHIHREIQRYCCTWNWLAQKTTTNRIILSQGLIIIRSKRNTYNPQSEQTQINLYLVAEFRKLEFRLTSVAGSRTLRVSSVLN